MTPKEPSIYEALHQYHYDVYKEGHHVVTDFIHRPSKKKIDLGIIERSFD